MIKIWIERTFYIETECAGGTYLGLGLNISLISLEICLFFSDWVWMVQFARHMAEETPNWQLRRPTPARLLLLFRPREIDGKQRNRSIRA